MAERRAVDRERGAMAVEVVLLAPVLVAFVILVVAMGRYVSVRGDVEAAARDAARAGSVAAFVREAQRRTEDGQRGIGQLNDGDAVDRSRSTFEPAAKAGVIS